MKDPSIITNREHNDFNDKSLHIARFVIVNSMPAIGEPLTANYCVDNVISDSVNEPTLVGDNQDNDFNIFNLTNINSFTLNTQAVNNSQVITKAYVDQFHQEYERYRRDVFLDFYDESNDLVKKNQRQKS